MKETTIQKMSESELIEKIAEYNEQLKSFGWYEGIGSLLYGCKTHGHLYEKKYYLSEIHNLIKPTPMNCLAVISHQKPDLIIELIHRHEYEQFLQLISKVGMCLEILAIKPFIIPKNWK